MTPTTPRRHINLDPADTATETGSLLAAAVLATLPHAVFVFSTQDLSRPVFENDAARAMQLSSDLFAPENAIGQAMAKTLAGGALVTLHDIDCGDGQAKKTVWINMAGDALVLSFAPVSHIVEHGMDARDALRPAAMMARTLAHEIKNPLAGICAAAQLLSQQAAAGTAAEELSGLILREGHRISRLVDRVAVFDETAPVVRLPLNVHAPLEQAWESFCMTSDIEVIRHFDPSLPDIFGDHDRLVQVFINLLRNAAEAGARRVVMRSFYVLDRVPVDKATHARLPIAVSIEDDGDGMNDETRARLFEAYYTTKADGQGLGLPIVAKIVHDLGGQIAVDSQAGKTVFTLYFPHSIYMQESR